MRPSDDPAGAAAALLPAGLHDGLPPDAAHEAALIERLVACFARYGYERVKPPLLEFEDSLLAGPGAQVAGQTFRLMDPVSQRMMGLRADTTTQVARIAASRLSKAPRPLRLCYAGQVLRVKGTQLRPERQFAQVGAELIGATAPRADSESLLLAVQALDGLGAAGLSVDLTLPTLVGVICAARGLDEGRAATLRAALDRKDAAAVSELAPEEDAIFGALLRAAGPAEEALERLRSLSLPLAATRQVERLDDVISQVRAVAPGLGLTVDPVEHRGFEYQTGLSFTLFATGVRGELGRGGRYAAPRVDGRGEPATGFTLYMDSVLRAVPLPQSARRIYLALDADPVRAAALRCEGWRTVAALEPGDGPLVEAGRQGCSHVLIGGEVRALEG